MKKTILITGAAGFIGFHLSKKLINTNTEIIGIDNLNNYYSPKLKLARINELEKYTKKINGYFKFIKVSLENKEKIEDIFTTYKPDTVINLAAQAGVRYSLENPLAYINSNLLGFSIILECSRNNNVKNFIYASSSSVYGGNKNLPFSEHDSVDHPVSLYAATKKSNELIAHSYSHLYGIPSTGLRFFTVYGPWGRPDMALFTFTKSIIEGKPIKVFNNGEMTRDFTYIDDIVEAIFLLINKPAKSNDKFNFIKPDPATSWAPHRVFNIGNSSPTPLMNYIEAIEKCLKKEAIKEFLPLQPGDVTTTASNCQELENWIGFKPQTSIIDGISKFISWYKEFYKINDI